MCFRRTIGPIIMTIKLIARMLALDDVVIWRGICMINGMSLSKLKLNNLV